MQIIKESDNVYIIKIIDYTFGWVDGLGFDILSFNADGNPKFIEVKTIITQSESFYVTKNELEFSKDNSEYFYLYKLLDLKPILYHGKF